MQMNSLDYFRLIAALEDARDSKEALFNKNLLLADEVIRLTAELAKYKGPAKG